MHDNRMQKEKDFRRNSREGEEAERRLALDSPLASEDGNERMFRDAFSADAMPLFPKIPGYHLCWLTSTNASDSPHRRIRIGYQPVKYEELPGFEHLRVKSGEFEGCISLNEMLLFKIPEDLYQKIMTELHWKAPLDEIDRMKSSRVLPQSDSRGVPLIRDVSEDLYGDGPKRVPKFE